MREESMMMNKKRVKRICKGFLKLEYNLWCELSKISLSDDQKIVPPAEMVQNSKNLVQDSKSRDLSLAEVLNIKKAQSEKTGSNDYGLMNSYINEILGAISAVQDQASTEQDQSDESLITCTFVSTIGSGDNELDLKLPAISTIDEVKNEVSEKTGLSPIDFHISYGGITLDESIALEEYLRSFEEFGEDTLFPGVFLIIPSVTAGATPAVLLLASFMHKYYEQGLNKKEDGVELTIQGTRENWKNLLTIGITSVADIFSGETPILGTNNRFGRGGVFTTVENRVFKRIKEIIGEQEGQIIIDQYKENIIDYENENTLLDYPVGFEKFFDDLAKNAPTWYRKEDGTEPIYYVIQEIITERLDATSEFDKSRNTDKANRIRTAITGAVKEVMSKLETEKNYHKIHKFLLIKKDEHDRHFVSFNEDDFEAALENFNDLNDYKKNGFSSYLYLIEVCFEADGKYVKQYYCGLSETKNWGRYRQEISRAIHFHVASEGVVGREGYLQLHQAITRVLFDNGGNLKDFYNGIDNVKTAPIIDFLDNKDLKKSRSYARRHIVELHYGNSKLGERETEYIEKFPLKEFLEKSGISTSGEKIDEFINLRTHEMGLNAKRGGGGLKRITPLPIYDMIIMSALGLSRAQIRTKLIEKYGLEVSEDSPKNQLIKEFGGVFNLQKKFMALILDYLERVEGISKRDIFLFYKDAIRVRESWINKYANNQQFLPIDFERIEKKFGISRDNPEFQGLFDRRERSWMGFSEAQWMLWIQSRSLYSSSDSLRDELICTKTAIDQFIGYVCAKYGKYSLGEFKRWLTRLTVVKAFQQKSISIQDKVTLEFKPVDLDENEFYEQFEKVFSIGKVRTIANYFEHYLFPGMSKEEIWERGVAGTLIDTF